MGDQAHRYWRPTHAKKPAGAGLSVGSAENKTLHASGQLPQCDFRGEDALVAVKLRIFPANRLNAAFIPIFNRIDYPFFFGCRILLVVQTQNLSRADDLRRLVDGAISRIGCLEWSCHVETPKTGTTPVPRNYRTYFLMDWNIYRSLSVFNENPLKIFNAVRRLREFQNCLRCKRS